MAHGDTGWRGSPVWARRPTPACRDAETLQLPAELALFPQRTLNRDLYLWLIALAAAHDEVDPAAHWRRQNQQGTLIALDRFPGLRSRYQRLVAACAGIANSAGTAAAG